MAKMKKYESFDEYLKDQSAANQAVIRALRRFVKREQPGLSEAVKWGNGCWVGEGGPVDRDGPANESQFAESASGNANTETTRRR